MLSSISEPVTKVFYLSQKQCTFNSVVDDSVWWVSLVLWHSKSLSLLQENLEMVCWT